MVTTKVRDGRLRQHPHAAPVEGTPAPLRTGEAVGCVPRLALPGEPEGCPRWTCWDSSGRFVKCPPDDVAARLHARLTAPLPEDRAYAY